MPPLAWGPWVMEDGGTMWFRVGVLGQLDLWRAMCLRSATRPVNHTCMRSPKKLWTPSAGTPRAHITRGCQGHHTWCWVPPRSPQLGTPHLQLSWPHPMDHFPRLLSVHAYPSPAINHNHEHNNFWELYVSFQQIPKAACSLEDLWIHSWCATWGQPRGLCSLNFVQPLPPLPLTLPGLLTPRLSPSRLPPSDMLLAFLDYNCLFSTSETEIPQVQMYLQCLVRVRIQ